MALKRGQTNVGFVCVYYNISVVIVTANLSPNVSIVYRRLDL